MKPGLHHVDVVSGRKIAPEKWARLMQSLEYNLLGHIAPAHTHWTANFTKISTNKDSDAFLSRQILEGVGLEVPLRNGNLLSPPRPARGGDDGLEPLLQNLADFVVAEHAIGTQCVGAMHFKDTALKTDLH